MHVLHRRKKVRNGLPRWLSSEESACQWRRHEFNPWVGKTPWRRKWQPTPVSLPGESRGRRSLAGCSPRGHKGSDTTEQLRARACTPKHWNPEVEWLTRRPDKFIIGRPLQMVLKRRSLFLFYSTCIIKNSRVFVHIAGQVGSYFLV